MHTTPNLNERQTVDTNTFDAEDQQFNGLGADVRGMINALQATASGSWNGDPEEQILALYKLFSEEMRQLDWPTYISRDQVIVKFDRALKHIENDKKAKRTTRKDVLLACVDTANKAWENAVNYRKTVKAIELGRKRHAETIDPFKLAKEEMRAAKRNEELQTKKDSAVRAMAQEILGKLDDPVEAAKIPGQLQTIAKQLETNGRKELADDVRRLSKGPKALRKNIGDALREILGGVLTQAA